MVPQSAIGHYRIVSKLGEGGMGAVYRATDTKLNRDVAVKVLPGAFASDAARMQRFEREAQLLAALNHPNIAAIYGVEQGAIVMELVEGASPAGPLPVATVLDYARQIVAGLEAAHEKGIVHRDLKPANIKVTPDGVVKLLDFGLAKAQDEAFSAPSGISPTISPTLSLAMTQAGMILGTAAYMSPEQARGKPVDKRADIWAFGVILFELLAGRHPYGTGETVTDTLAHIVLKEPDLATLPAETPARLRRLIGRCLQKDPKMRLRDIGEARILLDTPEAEPAAGAAPATRRSWLPWAIAGLAVTFAVMVAGRSWLKTPDPGLGAAHFVVPFPPGTSMPLAGAATQWVPSPDGRMVAMVVGEGGGNTALWLRSLNAPAARRIDKSDNAQLPFWSPDGKHIAFFQENKLKRVALAGGAAQTICDLSKTTTRATTGNGGAWGSDGTIVFADAGKPLLRVAAAGGVPAPVTSLDKNEISHSFPQFLPDGRHILYLARGSDPSAHAVYVQELGSPTRVRVLDSPTRALWSPPGYLLFTRGGTLFAQPMDATSFRLTGDPIPLAEDVVANSSNGRSTIAISQNGVLAYRTGTRIGDRQFSWRDRAGKLLAALGKPASFYNFSLSPDEKTVAVTLSSEAGYQTGVMDVSTGVITPVTREGGVSSRSPLVWSPDSQRLVVATYEGPILDIAVASGKAALVDKAPGLPYDWLPDGRSLLCADDGRLDLLSLSGSPASRTILTTPFAQTNYRLSPDGKYIAYTSLEPGTPEVYVASYPSFAVKRRVSTSTGHYALWAKGGRELFFRAEDGTLMVSEVRAGATIEASPPKPLFKFGAGSSLGNRFSVTADGERFLVAEFVQQAAIDKPEFHLMLNWQAKLDSR